MLLFLLSLKVTVTDKNENLIQEQTERDSHFMMLYSPHCGYCTMIHPEWIKLMDEYADSKEIVIADLDRVEHPTICRKYTNAGYPAFVLFQNGEKRKVDTLQNLENFRLTAEKIIENWKNPNCSELTNKATFPAFTYGNSSETDFGRLLVNHLNTFFNQTLIYVNRSTNSASFIVYTTRAHSFHLWEPFTYELGVEWITEYKNPPFSQTTRQTLTDSSRNLVCIFTDSLKELVNIRTIAYSNTQHFLWINLPFEMHTNLFMTTHRPSPDSLLIAVASRSKMEFSYFWDNTNCTILKSVLDQIHQKVYKFVYKTSFLNIFANKPNNDNFLLIKMNVVYGAFMAVIVAVFLCLCRRSSFNKDD
jgi:thiol-disulfide isomerase/thioredoxin